MKKLRHNKDTENISLTERLFFENETRTNRLGAWCLLAVTFFTVVLGIFIAWGFLNISGYRWIIWVLGTACVVETLLFFFVKLIGCENPASKYMILAGIILLSGITYFIYPLTTVFLFACPVLISIKYYSPKITAITAVFTWLAFIITVVANVVLEFTSPAMQALHQSQEMSLWGDVSYVLRYYVPPRTSTLIVEGVVGYITAKAGRKLVIDQAKLSTETAQMSAELDTASKIQNSSLAAPDYTCPDGNITLSANVKTARDVGGDFYDYFMVNEHLLVVVVADVSDKGLPAAMYAVEAQSDIRFAFTENFRKDVSANIEYIDLKKAVNAVNRQLTAHDMGGMFVTMWVGCFDTRTGAGKYVNAGHNPPYVMHPDGTVESITNDPQFFMGTFENIEYKTNLIRLKSNDVLLLYTDGATDAINESNVSFGAERLKESLSQCKSKTPKEIKNTIFGNIDEFAGGTARYDDITIIALKFNGEIHSEKSALNIDADETASSNVIDFVNEVIGRCGCPTEFKRDIDLIIDEVCSNISDYAYSGRKGTLNVELHTGANFISLRFEDEGMPFNPLLEASEPDTVGEPQVGGLGIYLIKNLADDVKYVNADGKNVLTVYSTWNM